MPADRKDQYARRKARARDAAAQQVAAGQDIGPLPPIANPERRAACAKSLRLFCETYHVARFPLKWSDDHLEVIERIESAVMHGGLFALAMPRGSGKTTLAEIAIEWAALYGYCDMVGSLAANKEKSGDILESIKLDLECNDLLCADFPEVCIPIRKLEGTANRCAGQTYMGVRTRITWTKFMVSLPVIAGSQASGVTIKVGGLTGGGVRGMKRSLPDGRVLRPKFVLIDDPQTDDTARSLTQNNNREKLLSGAVLGMAGPGEKIAAVMPCTVIVPNDMADRMLNSETHPDWQGVRKKMLYSFPCKEAMVLWEEYARMRADGLKRRDDGRAATEFYRHRRKAMDAGAVVAWPERYNDDEISAVQNAMNLFYRDEETFWAEYQNEPAAVKAKSEWATAETIAKRVNDVKRGEVPTACNHITMYMDVHEKLIFWAIIAWQDDFTGYVIDYGTYPEQPKRFFTHSKATKTLSRACQGAGTDGAIYAGLKAVCDAMLPRSWQRDDGADMRIGLAMIDANWNTTLVHKFIREYPAAHIFPAKGIGITAAMAPWEERETKPGERPGDHCRIAPTPNRTARGRHVVFDTNHWKTFIQRQLLTAAGDRGALTLYGSDPDSRVRGAEMHQLLAAHLTAESPVETTGRGRTTIEWKLAPSKPDNHWLDCVVGCAVLASLLGASSMPAAPTAAKSQQQQTTKRERKARYL